VNDNTYATASEEIDARIDTLDDWRGEILARLHALTFSYLGSRFVQPEIPHSKNWRL